MIPSGYTCHHFYTVVWRTDVQQFHNECPIGLRHTCNDIDQVLYSHKFHHACMAHVFRNSLNLEEKKKKAE